MESRAKQYVLRAMADDYEDFETVLSLAQELAKHRGGSLSRPDIAEALESVIDEGLAQAYVLSPAKSGATPVQFDQREMSKLWFYLTAEGRRKVEEMQFGSASQ